MPGLDQRRFNKDNGWHPARVPIATKPLAGGVATLDHRLTAKQASGLHGSAHLSPCWAFSPTQCANTLGFEATLQSDAQLRTHAFSLLERHLQIS